MQWNAGPEIDAGSGANGSHLRCRRGNTSTAGHDERTSKRRLRLAQPWSATETGGEPSNSLPTLPRRAVCRPDGT